MVLEQRLGVRSPCGKRGGCPSAASSGIWTVSVAPQRGGHERHPSHGKPAVAAILDRIRGSPVVHADETGWREDANGYVWTFSTPTERYFLRRGRGKAVVDEALGESFSEYWSAISTPPTTIMTAPNSGAGRCGTSTAHGPLIRRRPGFTTGPKPWRRTAQLAGTTTDSSPSGKRPSCADASSATSSSPQQQRRRTQPAPSGHQPQDQRRHPLGAGHREQDDASIPLRHLARPRSKFSPPAVSCSFPLYSELLQMMNTGSLGRRSVCGT